MNLSQTALVFPGQGSQSAGMLVDYFNNHKTFSDTFENAKEITGIDFKSLIFLGNSEDLSKTLRFIKQNKKIKYRDLIVNKNVSKVSIIGVGMITTPGVTYRMFQTLAKKRINILVISTSEIKISVLIEKKFVKKAISALHKEFKLD